MNDLDRTGVYHLSLLGVVFILTLGLLAAVLALNGHLSRPRRSMRGFLFSLGLQSLLGIALAAGLTGGHHLLVVFLAYLVALPVVLKSWRGRRTVTSSSSI